jgi:UDP-N-acetylglucosamine acyltransferase
MAAIHPTAIVDAAAELAASVSVGAYAVVGARVRIGAGTTIGPHTVVDGRTTIGSDNRIHGHCSIGGPPQDKKYAGEDTALEIGNGNTIREFCTLNTGTAQDEGVTRVGDDNWIMSYVHIAHDCRVGDHTILANAVQLAGHVHVGDWAILGGLTGVHQFVRIGAHAMAGFSSRLAQDLPPFVMAAGNPVQAQGFNQEGLRRRGFSEARIGAVKQMHRALYRKGLTLAAAIAEIEAMTERAPEAADDIALMLGFLAAAERGIVR